MKNPIYFLKFTDQKVFSREPLNVFFNQLFTFLINAASEDEILDHVLIDEGVALLLQDQPVNAKMIEAIEVCTGSSKIFTLIRTSLYALPISSVVTSESQIVFKVDDRLIKINFLSHKPSKVFYRGIGVRNKNEIKINS